MHHADLAGERLATTRMQRVAVWDTVQLTLNGAIFVLLGEQLPTILMAAPQVAARNHIANPWYLLLYVVLIGIALTVLRFVWGWASLKVSLLGSSRQPADGKRFFKRRLLVMTCSGVRGAITLAGILTLPIVMHDGSPFPARDLMILLAMGVILLSLISGSILLPLLTRGAEWKVETPLVRKEVKARSAAAKAAIAHMERLGQQKSDDERETQLRLEAIVRLTDVYRRRIDDGDAEDQESEMERARLAFDMEQKIHIEALGAERRELDRLRMSGQVSDTLHRRLVRELDLIETALLRQ
jgi:CPA1 family monovalent cation:H+ antiporter